MITLQAPYELIATSITLPSPSYNNLINLVTGIVNFKRSITGLKYTYLKVKNRKKFIYNFTLHRNKSLELEAFIELYLDNNIKLINHEDEIWNVVLTNNPFDFVGKLKGEWMQIGLEFEGVNIYTPTILECEP